MPAVVLTQTAVRNLRQLIKTHSLRESTPVRLRRSIEPLGAFPLLGAPLHGRWAGTRFVLGPWRWMIVVYRYDRDSDRVSILTIQDGRSARAPTSRG